MSRLGWMALGVVLAAASARCGYPTFIFNGDGGAGGASASSASSSQGSSSQSSSGTGGSGPKTCHVLEDAKDCGPAGRCTVADPSTGMLGCVTVATSPLAPYDACPHGDGDCPAGTWCDGRTHVCMPFCTPGTPCSGSGSCVAASTGTAPVPGEYVCTAHCEPITAAPCKQGATCVYDTHVLDFDCFQSQNASLNGSCLQADDCGKGLVCGVDTATMQGSCLLWCSPTQQFTVSCPGDGYCTDFVSPLSYNGSSYGYCG